MLPGYEINYLVRDYLMQVFLERNPGIVVNSLTKNDLILINGLIRQLWRLRSRPTQK